VNTRIWFTRRLSDAEISLAHEKGIKPIIHPLIHIRIFSPDSILESVKKYPKPDAIAFTSKNGTDAFLGIPSAERSWEDSTPLYCIGNVTAEKLMDYGFKVTISDESTGSELAKRIAGELGPGSVIWHFCSTIKRPETGDVLRDAGLTYVPVECYETIELSDAGIPSEPFSGIVFYSPSAVRAFANGNASIQAEVMFFAIGDTTAGELKKYGFEDVVTPAIPSTESLLETLHHYLPDTGRTKSGDK
jgi:uroporphyrinogen-III synthase